MSKHNVIQLPSKADKKTQEKAQKWLAEKRKGLAARRKRNEELFAGLLEDMEELGIDGVRVGNVRISVQETPVLAPSLSSPWTDHIQNGGELFVLEVSSAYCGFMGDDHVNPEKRKVEELVDLNVIAQLTPDTVVFVPGQQVPWEAILPKYGFQLWVSSRHDLDVLWQHMDRWLKTKWHDEKIEQLSKNGKARHKFVFERVAGVSCTRVIASDLDMRIARHLRAEKAVEAAVSVGLEDTASQEAIKRGITALVAAESHPVFGQQITEIIDNLMPCLEKAMKGKALYKKLEAEENRLRNEMFKGIKQYRVKFNERPVALPVI